LSAAVLDTPHLLNKSIVDVAEKEKLIIFIDNRKNFNTWCVLSVCPTSQEEGEVSAAKVGNFATHSSEMEHRLGVTPP
jgi:hypothetical protein